MRLHRLSLAAVGPFAAAQEVDFDALGASGMFLLEGPTGVGKTTVLDAITFALYGQGPRRESDPGRMHSHFAPAGERPRVDLEFSVAGARFRVVRTARHERPKRRGAGTLTVDPTVSLSRWDASGWVELTHDNAEAGTYIGELLGLTREQFCQVVALPQGQFARFLQSDDDQRRALLTKLFGTELFDRVTEEVGEQARTARASLAAVQGRIATALAATLEAGAVADADTDAFTQLVAGGVAAHTALLGELESQEELLAAQHSRASTVQERLTRRLSRRERAAALAQVHSERMARLVRVNAELAVHEASRCSRDQAEHELAQARRAAPVAVLLDQLVAAEGQLNVATADLDEARAGADAALTAGIGEPALRAEYDVCVEAIAPGARLADLAGAWRELAAKLGPAQEAEAELAGLSEARERLAAEADRARAGLTESMAQEASRTDLLRQSQAVRNELEVKLGGHEQVRGELQRCLQAAQAAGRAEQLAQRAAAASVALRSAIDTHQAAVARHQELVADRISGMRAELALMLVAGQPCTVCGATEHPDPATTGTAPTVSAAQLSRAAAAQDGALARRSTAESELAAVREELASARAAAGGLSLLAAQAEVESHQQRLAEFDEMSRVVADLAALEQRLVGEIGQLEVRLADDHEALVAMQAELALQEATITRQLSLVQAARQCYPSVAARRGHLSRAAAAVAQLGRLWDGAQTARRTHAELADLVCRELASHGLPSIAAAREARRTQDQVQGLAALVRHWDDREAQLKGQLQAPELAGLDPLDLEQALKAAEDARTEFDECSEAARAARAEVVTAQRRLERFGACLAVLRDAITEHAALEQGSASLAELDRLVRGMDGRKRMTLTTYVLRYWFSQVVAAANLRLATMSAGKYELVRVEDADSRRDRVGLGLSILDRHTGMQRSTRSLSGGETFYTSLALALGLSDVVAGQAGGVSLDTLFVDEGFGTLDPDTLEEVMSVLDDLRGNGRVVGVVSHVAELKDRIPERLEVRRERPDGPSRLRVIA